MTTLVLLAGSTTMALAHPLPEEEGVVAQLDHQVFGMHHLPLTILLVIIGVMIFRKIRKTP
jgi:hypothetical protein